MANGKHHTHDQQKHGNNAKVTPLVTFPGPIAIVEINEIQNNKCNSNTD
jgi:hypothetical protein